MSKKKTIEKWLYRGIVMKNISSFIKRIICLVTLIAICLSTFSLSVMASENNCIEKIDSQLSLLLSDMSDNDTITIYV